jgi:LacI family transcriptional regulator
MAASIKDIARELNISVSTVSRVINGQGRFSEKTRYKVVKMMEQLNYRPNEAARALREKSSKTLGRLVPDIGNTFFAHMIKGAESIAWQEDYSLFVIDSNGETERERRALRLLLDKRVAGIILASVDPECPMFFEASQQGVPIVFTDNLPSLNVNFDSVTIDNRIQAYRLTRHLIDNGHTRIAMINGCLAETTAEQRRRGYTQAMDEASLDHNVKSGSFQREFGRSAMDELLCETARPTAVFAASNHLAYGAINAIRKANLSVPKDISLVCFDTHDETGLLIPELCTANQPAERIGEVSVDILFRKLNGNGKGMHERVYLDAEVVWGASVAPPPSRA